MEDIEYKKKLLSTKSVVVPKVEKITCKIFFESKHNPTCKVVVNGKTVHDFTATSDHVSFDLQVEEGPIIFRFIHYGKDMKKQVDKFIELKKIYFNDFDLKNLIWETTQVPDLPAWQNSEDFEWKSNLYFGHNGYVEYKFWSPVLDYLWKHHTKGAKVSSNMGSYNMELLYEMKEYFSKIVKEQDEKLQ